MTGGAGKLATKVHITAPDIPPPHTAAWALFGGNTPADTIQLMGFSKLNQVQCCHQVATEDKRLLSVEGELILLVGI